MGGAKAGWNRNLLGKAGHKLHGQSDQDFIMTESIKYSMDRAFLSLIRWGMVSRHGIRILMYHATPEEPVVNEQIFISVSERILRIQFELIRDLGYNVISLENALNILKQGQSINETFLVISFDDFFENILDVALPLLQEFGFKAVFFPATRYLDSDDPFPWIDGGQRYGKPGTREMVKELASLGHEIGSHSHSHPRLKDLDEKQLNDELLSSKEILEDLIQTEIRFFSYPYGDINSFDPSVKEKLCELGYTCALTTLEGINVSSTDPLSLRRTAITEQDLPDRFTRKLQGARDWFYLRQLLQGK
jgi:peptidoglycan/xylan/chitin deacetylase (PgdA/CDA1 family)